MGFAEIMCPFVYYIFKCIYIWLAFEMRYILGLVVVYRAVLRRANIFNIAIFAPDNYIFPVVAMAPTGRWTLIFDKIY
ncbi:hypothetical protein A9976_04110 [Delftia sp. UME58]|nr:hypothetical protein [Delftia sp. UME58]